MQITESDLVLLQNALLDYQSAARTLQFVRQHITNTYKLEHGDEVLPDGTIQKRGKENV